MQLPNVNLLRKVNFTFNKLITYRRDKKDGYGDYWKHPEVTLREGYGDCEDSAIVKAFVLITKHQVNEKFIRIACCYTEMGEGHAVCLVRAAYKKFFFFKREAWFVLDINKPYFTRYDKSKLDFVTERSYTYEEALLRCKFDADIRK